MFEHPVSVPANTVYARLGLSPAATMAEIQDAKASLTAEISAASRRVGQRLDEVDGQVEGLRAAREELKRSREQAAPSEELSAIRARLGNLERAAEKACPDYRKLLRERDELKERLERTNGIEIASPEGRAAYDAKHPPLALLRLETCAPDLLGNDPSALPLLRAAISAFLEDQGETVFHPTDITRREFAGDFTPTPLLDEEGP